MADPMPKSPPTSNDSTKRNEPTGYGRIARKWSRLSSNLLASGLVIVAAIGLLRYVAPWWSQEEPPSSKEHVAQTVGKGVETDHPLGVLSAFGDLAHSLRQAKYVGELEGARDRLRQLCRQAAEKVPQSDRPVGPAEQNMLTHLGQLSPVEEELGRWRMYEAVGPAPIVAVVPWCLSQPNGDDGNAVGTERGVLSWGIAVPGADSNWTLFTYPGSGDELSEFPGVPGLELPTGTSRIMSLADENGGAMLAFSGSADLVASRRHFDRWATSTDTPVITPWRKIGRQWVARFGDERAGWVDVHLFADGGRLTGGFLAISGGTESVAPKK